MQKVNVYQIVTDRIISELEKGIIPWRKPWSGVGLADGGAINYVSRKPYSMLNQMLLCRDGEYLTFKQIKDLKGNIKKGAKSQFVVFFSFLTPTKKNVQDENGENIEEEIKTRPIPMLRYYNVFHIDDCKGIESKFSAEEPTEPTALPIEKADGIIEGYLDREKTLKFQNDKPSNRAFYSLSKDKVVVPMMSQYQNSEAYYSTTFHELIHSTIPLCRCNRKAENAQAFFGNEDYSREELVAEIGSAMICNAIGLNCEKTFINSVSYIQSWLKALKNNNKMIVWAASRAEKAAKYIMNVQE